MEFKDYGKPKKMTRRLFQPAPKPKAKPEPLVDIFFQFFKYRFISFEIIRLKIEANDLCLDIEPPKLFWMGPNIFVRVQIV